jgi:hypothetical protein
MGKVLSDMLLERRRASAHWITSIQDLDQNIGRIYYLVQLLPNALALTCRHTFVSVLGTILIFTVL